MALLDIATLKLLAPEAKTVDNTALQLLLDAAEEAIDRAVGSIGSNAQERPQTGYSTLILKRPAETIVSITVDGVALATDQYRHSFNGYVVERIGAASEWSGDVVVTYTPVDDLNLRKEVQRDWVKLSLAYSGYISEGEPEHSRSRFNIEDERAKLMARLREPGMAIL